jgi:hypothetical protein
MLSMTAASCPLSPLESPTLRTAPIYPACGPPARAATSSAATDGQDLGPQKFKSLPLIRGPPHGLLHCHHLIGQ